MISTEKTFKFNKKTSVYKLPRVAIYKPPCVQLINNPFFAKHQVFALSICVSFPRIRQEKGAQRLTFLVRRLPGGEGVQKVCAKKVRVHFSFPKENRGKRSQNT